MKKELICLCLSAALCGSVLTGCNKTDVATSDENLPKGEITYPIDTDVTLEYWVRLSPALGTSVTKYSETEFAKEYMEKTGIKVNYTHPAQGQETESLNLLIASGKYPDIIESNWLSRDPDSMIAKKVILPLNDYFKDYSPNVSKFLAENPEIDKQVKTDQGNYYVYPFIRNDDKLLSTSGFMMRSDWLEELNLEVPETIEEWENVLTQFKKKGDVPLVGDLSTLFELLSGFNCESDMYLRDGKVVYGPTEDNFKEWLVTMKRWYDNGLIDVNFAVGGGSATDANILNDVSGACYGAGGSGLGKFLSAMKDSGKSFDLTAVPFPTHEKGATPEFGKKSFEYSEVNSAAITTACKHPQLAARFLDYSYSEEGYMLNNFGIEGVSYEMVDGYPTYTETVTNNPDGLAMSQAMPLYFRSSTEGPFVQDVRYIEQYYQLPQQQKALEYWSANNDLEHKIPQVTMTPEETTEYSAIMNDITTKMEESAVNFILGRESIDNFDQYVSTLKAMKLDRAVEIKQAAVERFQQR